jgi:Family of unknown function (DUF6263)
MTVYSRRVVTGLAVLTVAVLVGGASLTAFRQEATLRYRWTKGETARYRLTQQSTSTITGLPGGMGDITIEQSTAQVYRIAAKDVAADGTTTLDQMIESVTMQMDAPPMGKMSFDSTKPDAPSGSPMDDMLKKMLTPLVGAPFTLTLTSTGSVQKVEGLSQAVEKMFASLPQDPQMQGMMSGLKANLSDDGMKGMFSQGFAQLPQQAVKPGDTWKTSFTIPNPAIGMMTTTTVSTLQGVEGSGANQVAKIATKLTITQDPDSKGQMPMGMTAKLGTATGDGEVLFDLAKGQARKGVTRLTMPLTISGSAPDGTTMNMMSTVKTTLTIEIVP